MSGCARPSRATSPTALACRGGRGAAGALGSTAGTASLCPSGTCGGVWRVSGRVRPTDARQPPKQGLQRGTRSGASAWRPPPRSRGCVVALRQRASSSSRVSRASFCGRRRVRRRSRSSASSPVRGRPSGASASASCRRSLFLTTTGERRRICGRWRAFAGGRGGRMTRNRRRFGAARANRRPPRPLRPPRRRVCDRGGGALAARRRVSSGSLGRSSAVCAGRAGGRRRPEPAPDREARGGGPGAVGALLRALLGLFADYLPRASRGVGSCARRDNP